MSRSQRDIDIRRMRQLSQAMNALISTPWPAKEVERIRRLPAHTQLQAEFDRLFAHYGANPEIFKDNERAGSKRGVNRKIKDAVRRSRKRSDKQSMHPRSSVASDDDE